MIGHLDRCIDKRGIDYLERIFNDISAAMGSKDPIEAIDTFETIMSEMELANPVSTNREDDLKVLSTSVNPVRLKNNPVKLEEKTTFNLFEEILDA